MCSSLRMGQVACTARSAVASCSKLSDSVIMTSSSSSLTSIMPLKVEAWSDQMLRLSECLTIWEDSWCWTWLRHWEYCCEVSQWQQRDQHVGSHVSRWEMFQWAVSSCLWYYCNPHGCCDGGQNHVQEQQGWWFHLAGHTGVNSIPCGILQYSCHWKECPDSDIQGTPCEHAWAIPCGSRPWVNKKLVQSD